MPQSVTGFALLETIPVTYTGISYAGKTPDSLTGLTFFFTVRQSASPRTEMVRKTSSSGLTVVLVDGAPKVTCVIDTAQASPAYSIGTVYEVDFWVVDAATGSHRLDTWQFTLDEPETTDFTP